MNATTLGKQLLALCGTRNKCAEIERLLEGLSEDRRRAVLDFKDAVSES